MSAACSRFFAYSPAMPAKANPPPLTLEAKLEALREKLARLKAELVAIQEDATAAGFPMEPVRLLLGRLAGPRRRRWFKSPKQLEFTFMAVPEAASAWR